MPTAPEAPIAPQISIGDRIHGIESRIEEIEGISGINSTSKSRSNTNNQRQQENDSEEAQEEQSQTSQQSQPRQTQSTPQVQQRQPSARKVETPETMARDAVANGSGALTKRTTQRGNDNNDSQNADGANSQAKNQTTVVIPPNSSLNDDGRTSFERGRAVLNEFKQLDQEEAAKQGSLGNSSSSSSTPTLFTPSYDSNSHGVAYWLFTLIAIGVLAFVFVKQFLVNKDSPSDTPPLTKSTLDIPDISQPLSNNSPAMKKAALNQYKQNVQSPPKSKPVPSINKTVPPITKPTSSIAKPVTLKTKTVAKTEDDSKGGHFEVRV